MVVDFYLVGEKGFVALNRFLEKTGASNVGVVVAARDAGTEEDYFDEIKNLCSDYSVVFIQRGNESVGEERGNYSFAIGWRWMIPDLSKLIVFHDSLLPKYRGFSPLVNMLINGETEIGVTSLLASDEYDKGDILARKSVSISYPMKIGTAIKIVADLYADIVIEVYENLLFDRVLVVEPQDEALATYSLWRDEADYLIDWRRSSLEVKRFCDAVGYPYKGASAHVGGEKIFILDVEVFSDVVVESRAENLGKTLFLDDNCPVVVCGKGLLKIKAYRFECDENKKLNFRSRFSFANMVTK